MNETKRAIIIDSHQLRGKKVEEILHSIYERVDRPEPFYFKHVINSLSKDPDFIDIVVVGNGGYLEEVLEQHRQYAIPTILRVDVGSLISSEIAAKDNQGYYKCLMMVGIKQDVQEWQKYINEAKEKVKQFKK